MSLKYTVKEEQDPQYDLELGDYVLDDTNNDVYIVTLINERYALVALEDGLIHDESYSTLEELKGEVDTNYLEVFKKGDISINLYDKVTIY